MAAKLRNFHPEWQTSFPTCHHAHSLQSQMSPKAPSTQTFTDVPSIWAMFLSAVGKMKKMWELLLLWGSPQGNSKLTCTGPWLRGRSWGQTEWQFQGLLSTFQMQSHWFCRASSPSPSYLKKEHPLLLLTLSANASFFVALNPTPNHLFCLFVFYPGGQGPSYVLHSQCLAYNECSKNFCSVNDGWMDEWKERWTDGRVTT